MGSDSIPNTLLPSISKDFAKKKRTNRLAKLKQSKLDVRREQWLSQVKRKGCILDSNRRGESPPSSLQIGVDQHNRSLDSLEITLNGEENEGASVHDSDLESLMNSPIGSSSGLSDSRKGGSNSSSSSTSVCCSESFSEQEDDDGCLDDWEAVADALNASDYQHNQISDSPAESDTRNGSPYLKLPNRSPRADLPRPENKEKGNDLHVNCQAWRADDAFRPQTLPHFSKKHNYSTNSKLQSDRGGRSWAMQKLKSQPSSCPICYEELDITDSSFLPCPCGFRLCLFCHKRIVESDARCPCCRKQYDHVNGDMTVKGGGSPFGRGRACMNTTML